MADRATSEAWSKISLIIMKLLHHIGINKKTRRRRRYMWTQHEKLLSVISSRKSRNWAEMFVFGSQIEGSTTPGLKSDLDIVSLTAMFTVRNIQDAAPGILKFLMVRDEDTYPGYYKLQLVNQIYPEDLHVFQAFPHAIIAVDRNQRIVMNASSFFYYNHETEIHGPAATVPNPIVITDYIMAVRVATRTQENVSWLLRPRQNTWITQNEFEYFLEKELFLVPVGNPLSFERHLEWRLSFTVIERELMWRLNNTQIACCVLMKMINKCFITPAVGKCVSSYHCKTLLFHLIDNTDVGFWKPSNLLTCLNLMLKTLSLWVESGFCPNYFIANENMFLGKLHGQLRTRLHILLVHLIDQDFKYLTQIGCDGLGQALLEACSKHHTHPDAVPAVLEVFQRRNDCDFLSGIAIWFRICFMSCSYTKLLHFGELPMHHTLMPWYHTCNTFLRDYLSVLTALLCSHFGSQLASSCIATNSMNCSDMEIAHMFLSIGTTSDVTAGSLKLAGFYLKLGYASLAEEVLIAVEQHFGHFVSDVSPMNRIFFKKETIHKIMSEEMTTAQIFKSCIALSVIYLPSEIHCTLPPLCFEMFRSVGAGPELRDPQKDYWYDWAVVDARPYMYFLQHQTYSALGMQTHRMVALLNLTLSIMQERMVHTDTCLNLMAYCLRQEGLVNPALECLLLSLQLKPEHNAAVWQIFDLLTQIHNNQSVF